jgi:hypothetical protein
MAASLGATVLDALRDTVAFLVIAVVWIVVGLALYGVFIVTKPSGVTYDPWVHASVFAVPGFAYLAHLLKQALKD